MDQATVDQGKAKRFKIALSFSGKNRKFVEAVADELSKYNGFVKKQILYDAYHKAEFARSSLDIYLTDLYSNHSEMIAVFLCKDYEAREWCGGIEWHTIRELIIAKRKTAEVMLLRFDDTQIPGLNILDGFFWIENHKPKEIAAQILERYQINQGLIDNNISVQIQSDSDTKLVEIENMTAKLHEVIIKQVEAILSSNPVLLVELKIEAQLDNAASAIDVAKYLILQNIAGNAIRQLASANLAVEKKLSSQLEKWNEHLDHAEQLCGWFLLNTVDPEWWWANQQQLLQAKQLNVAQSLTLDNTVYIEVVISHNLLKQAKFKVDSYGDLIPDNDMASPYLFDAISPGASDIQLLSEIYKDLRKSTQAPQNVSELIKKIALTANNMVATTRKGKLIYYIVSKSYLDALQAMDCYADLQEKLAGFVQFICCTSGEANATSACTEDQDALLETVAGILRLRNVKR